MSKINELFLLNVAFPFADKVMGTCAMKWYKQIVLMNTWSKEQVMQWQNEQLQRFVQHSYNNTIYYKRVFDDLKINPLDIQSAEDLKKLPIITKEIARAHYDEIVPKNISGIKNRISRTGGTTGEPMQYLCDENTWGYVTAAKIFYWKKTEYHYGDRFVALGSSSLFSKKPSLARRVYDRMRCEIALNSVNMTDDICANYVGIIKKNHVRFIYGYAASIFVFTQFVAKNNIDLTQIQAVFTSSENLTDAYRTFISDTYQCRVMDCYGAKDAGITAYEVDYKKYCVGYNVIAETVDPIEVDTGTLLSTNILNYSFPLIRYQFGDEVCLPQKGDNCYNGQLITRLLGRSSDVMRLRNGHNLTSTGFSMIIKEFDVYAFEVEKIKDMSIELRLQINSNLFSREQEQMIMKTIRNYVGEDCALEVKYVDGFKTLPNGKRRYFINQPDM